MTPHPRQRGAAGLTAIATLAMAVIFAALAIDVGRLGWEAKKVQNIADLAAVDAIRQAGLCSGVTALDQSALEAAAQASAVRNGYSGDLGAEGGVVAGTLTTVSGKHSFVPVAAIADANALQVTASEAVTSSLVAGGWLGGTTSLQRRAVAYDEVLGAFSEGSFLLSVDSDDSLVLDAVLGGLLGGSVNLSALSYEGLASAQVSLGDLANAAGPSGVGVSAGTVDSFLQANVTAGEFLQIVATALTGAHTSYADVNGLVTATTNLNNFTVSDLLAVSSDNPESAADVMLNVFDLISGSAQVANAGNGVSLPMTLNLPLGLGSVTVLLYITEGPQYAIGPPGVDSAGEWKTQVHTSPVRLQINVTLTGGLPILSGLVDVSGELALYADIASASAWLENIQCANAVTLAHVVNIGVQTGAAELGIGQFDDITDPASGISDTPTLSLDVAGGLASLTANPTASVQVVDAQNGQVSFTVNSANPLEQTQTASTSLGNALNTATSSLAGSLEPNVKLESGLLGLGLGVPEIATGLVDELLAPLLGTLDELLLDPLFRALGIHLGGADVTLHAIERGDPRLAG